MPIKGQNLHPITGQVMSTYKLKVIDWDNKNDKTSTEQLLEGYHL